MSKPTVEIIDPRQAAPRTTRLEKPVFDSHAIDRANEAMKQVSGSFGEWLETDVAKLQGARLAAERLGWTDDALNDLFAAAHDLKGMGSTYGFPLATQLAASLCRLIETDAGKHATRATPSLATAHVDAIRAAMRDGIKSSANPVGRALLQALETRVESLGVAPE